MVRARLISQETIGLFIVCGIGNYLIYKYLSDSLSLANAFIAFADLAFGIVLVDAVTGYKPTGKNGAKEVVIGSIAIVFSVAVYFLAPTTLTGTVVTALLAIALGILLRLATVAELGNYATKLRNSEK